MVQILPQEDSFGALLGTGLSQGLLQSLQQRQQAKQATALGNVLGLEGQELQQFGKLSPEQQKLAADVIKQREKKTAELIAPEKKENLKDVMGRLRELSGKGHTGPASKYYKLSPEARETRAEFHTLGSSIEAALLPLVNKGTLARERFKYILSLLPNPSDTKPTIEGKLKALEREFGLMEKEQKFGKTSEGMKGKTLSKDTALKFLKAAKGDKEKAREMAKKAGFSF